VLAILLMKSSSGLGVDRRGGGMDQADMFKGKLETMMGARGFFFRGIELEGAKSQIRGQRTESRSSFAKLSKKEVVSECRRQQRRA
jgi:hypothetical protein